MQQPWQSLTANIDDFLNDRYASEPLMRQEQLRIRLADLCSRRISWKDAEPYLKSGGWSLDVIPVYAELLNYRKNEKDENMSDKKFSTEIVEQLLQELLVQLAAAAGFRDLADGEDVKVYRKEFMKYLESLSQNKMDDDIREHLKQMTKEAAEYSTKACEVLRALSAYYSTK